MQCSSLNFAALLRLQQILFFKELDFSLADIKSTIDRPGFDTLQALRAHRKTLEERLGRLSRLIETVDRTILHVKGELKMAEREFYQGSNEEKQREYEEEIRQRYGVKRRPAVVLSSEASHSTRPDAVLGLLTGQVAAATAPTDHLLRGWLASGLRAPTAFRTFLITLPREDLVAVVGHPSAHDWSEVQTRLRLAIAV
jgi:DNA-binding transcriptional MerR regulator/mRNA-degrading endonuclease toxin of MazEF toxin-antitoxin module